jgi:hypothetical protein
MARQGAGELEAVHLRAGPRGCRARPRNGLRPSRMQQLPRPAPADRFLRAAARQRAPAAHRLGDRTRSSAFSASATTARATATADGRSGVATQTTQMTSSAVCVLTTLAFLLKAARLAASRTLPGGVCLAGHQDVARHTRALGQLRASALGPAVVAWLPRSVPGMTAARRPGERKARRFTARPRVPRRRSRRPGRR